MPYEQNNPGPVIQGTPTYIPQDANPGQAAGQAGGIPNVTTQPLMTGVLANDIPMVRQEILRRINERKLRYPVAGSVDALMIDEDTRRLALLDSLLQVSGNPAYTQQTDNLDTAQKSAVQGAIKANSGAATGKSSTAAAGRGLLGGSAAAADKGRIAATTDAQQQGAARQLVDARRTADQGDRATCTNF